MRLVWVKIDGFRRFGKPSKLNTEAKVIALVGPNEAGKTSLVEAIQHLSIDEPFTRSGASMELTRGRGLGPRHPVVSAGFLLTDDDRAAITHLNGGSKADWFFVEKRVDGRFMYSISPTLKRDTRPRRRVAQLLRRAANNNQLGKQVVLSGSEAILDVCNTLVSELDTESENLAQGVLPRLGQLADELDNLADSSQPKYIQNLSSQIRELADREEAHPGDSAIDVLKDRLPEFLLFSEADRLLQAEYDITEGRFPPALENLAALAGIDLRALRASIRAGDAGQKETLIQRANGVLEQIFSESWSQSGVSVHLDTDGNLLQILVGSVDSRYVSIAERSEGLRWFAALLSFVSSRNDAGKPILLVDEAESHLHYDAQADLVQMFAKQEVADKIIYTTHSVGCLPEDLGRGVRLVEPTENDSTISNAFWNTNVPGFSPLLFRMGAKTLAFIPVRYAVFTEGATDLILLPSLLREAIDREHLGFQIAPGLSSATEEQAALIKSEAPRAAYLLDSDEGGDAIARKLRKVGIPDHLIVRLPKTAGMGMVTEDFVDPQVYVDAVNSLLHRRYGDGVSLGLDVVSSANRPRAVKNWCNREQMEPPNRVALAYEMLEKAEGKPLLFRKRRRALVNLHTRLKRVLYPDLMDNS